MQKLIEQQGGSLELQEIGVTKRIAYNMVCYKPSSGLWKLTSLRVNNEYADCYTGDVRYFLLEENMILATENSDGTIRYQLIAKVNVNDNTYDSVVLKEKEALEYLGDDFLSRIRQAVFSQSKLVDDNKHLFVDYRPKKGF